MEVGFWKESEDVERKTHVRDGSFQKEYIGGDD
jgi:hypothetical protein